MRANISRRELLTALPLAVSALGFTRLRNEAEQTGIASLPFVAGSMGFHCFRTPALAISAQGTILAFSGGRIANCKDDGDHDIVLRRSSDGGRQWGPLQVLANEGKNRCDIPVPVVLATGRILLLWMRSGYVNRKQDRQGRRLLVCHSDDDGLSWSAARDITAQVVLPGWKPWFGIGPGHGFVKQRPPAAGRIIIPARHGLADGGSRSHLLYSDDGGLRWHVGAQALGPRPSNEATACELGDGTVLLNSRSEGGYRVSTLCGEGGQVALRSESDRALIEPSRGCQASLLTYALPATGTQATLLFSNPQDQQQRRNGRIRLSRDNGRTWSQGFAYATPANAFSGYSDLARCPNGDVAVLHETALSQGRSERRRQRRHDGIRFRRIPFQLIASSP